VFSSHEVLQDILQIVGIDLKLLGHGGVGDAGASGEGAQSFNDLLAARSQGSCRSIAEQWLAALLVRHVILP
jgi:hypothetical protein